jgi:hypothetical protein
MAVRSGMAEIINDLRIITEAGRNDWTVETITYFSDDFLQTVLDNHAEPFVYEGMEPQPAVKISDGTFRWSVYKLDELEHIEASTGGTAIFYVQDYMGGTISSSAYTMDYRRGWMTLTIPFNLATPYFATGYAYDINAAASDVWRLKANHAAASFKFSTDNHTVDKTSLYKQYMAMADYYASLSEDNAGGHGEMEREDTETC